MQLNKIMYIDLVDPTPKITHRPRVTIAVDQITPQCVTIMNKRVDTDIYIVMQNFYLISYLVLKHSFR